MKRFVTLLVLSLFAFASAYAQTVSVDDIYSNKGSEITIPIKINDATATAFTSGQFVLEYDTSIVEILSVAVGSVVSDPNAQLINNNTVRAPGIGEYRVAISSTVPFTKGEGTLAVLTARVKNYGQSTLVLANTLLNTGAPAVVQNGLLNTSIPITISGPERLDQGTTGTYSVSVGDLSARNISSFQFTIGFDSNLLNVANIANGPILDGLSTESSVLGSAVRVAYGSQTALAGNGVLFTFEATANSSNTGTSTFNFSDVLFNTGTANGENTHVVTTPAFGVMVQDYVFITLEGNSLSTTLGGTSVVDINASDLTDEGVFSYQFVLDYPENDVAIDSVVFVNDLNANNSNGIPNIANGVVNGGSFSQTAYAGAGTLAKVYVRNLTKGTHRLSFNSFTVNTGSPIASTSTIDLTVNNTAPSAPIILVPGAGDTVSVAGLPTATIVPTWSASTDVEMDVLNYTWELSASMSFDTTLLSVNAATDTSVTLTNAAVEALLVANGVTRGQSITLYHRAIARDGDSMTAGAGSAATFSLGVVNTPPTATNILVPADGDTVNVAGLPTAEITPTWSASTDADVTDTLNYTWELATDTAFSTILLSVPTMQDTSVTLTNAAVKALLEVNGVNVGNSITLYHRANTNDGDIVVNGNRAAATFSLGVVNTPPVATTILVPANGDTVNVMGLPTATISPTWSASSDADMDTLNYTWELATDSTFSTVLLSVPTALDTSVTLTLDAVRNLLVANNVAMGNTISLYHRANVSDSKVSVNGNFANAVFKLGLVNTPPTATSIVIPANQDTLSIDGLPTDVINPSWTVSTDADGDTVNYVWELAADSAFSSVLLSVPTTTDTTVSLSLAAVKSLLEANGLMRGEFISLYHRANATDSKEITNGNSAIATFALGLVNTPPTATMITAPTDSAIVNVVGLPTDPFVPMWTAASDADGDTVSYNWQLSVSPDFAAASLLADVAVGRDTLLNLTLSTVDAILDGAGVNVGDTVRVYHRANSTDSLEVTNGMSATVWLVRGLVNTPPTAAEITVPGDGTEITIQGDPTAPFVPRWSESTDADGDNVTYTWQLATSASFDSASVLVSIANLTSEQVDLDNVTVAGVLDAAGAEVGVPVTLYHRAQSTDGKVTTNGVSKSVVLVRGTLTNIGEELPVEFGLNQNYPNPFNPVTTISYQVAESRMVSVNIYDMLGRKVATLVNEVQPAGSYNISFDAARLSTGIYIYRMVSGDFVQTRKMTLMK